MHCAARWCTSHHCRALYLVATRKWRHSCWAAVPTWSQHEKGHIKLHRPLWYSWLTTLGETNWRLWIFFLFSVMNHAVFVLSVWVHIYLFVVLVVSLNKLCNTDEAHCSSPSSHHSCTVAPPTLIWCNVLQEDPPLPWAIPCGTHLHYKLRVQKGVCLKCRDCCEINKYNYIKSVTIFQHDAYQDKENIFFKKQYYCFQLKNPQVTRELHLYT